MNTTELELIERKEETDSNNELIVTSYYKCACGNGKVVEVWKNGQKNITIECETCRNSYEEVY